MAAREIVAHPAARPGIRRQGRTRGATPAAPAPACEPPFVPPARERPCGGLEREQLQELADEGARPSAAEQYPARGASASMGIGGAVSPPVAQGRSRERRVPDHPRSPRASLRSADLRSREFPRTREHRVPHRARQPAGLRVLPARVVRAEQPRAVGHAVLRAVRELRALPRASFVHQPRPAATRRGAM